MPLSVEIRLGDITAQPDMDAIVNPTNDQLLLLGAVGGAIRRAGGEQLDADAQAKGPVEPGEVVATGAGTLPNLYVLHAAILGTRAETMHIPHEHGSATNGEIIGAAVLNALQRAEQLGLRSIAFPPMGVELASYPLEHCVNVMLDQITGYASVHSESLLRRVVIVCTSQAEFAAFNRRVIGRLAS
jgi:O-acetyl-ADP-ribose deacetylase